MIIAIDGPAGSGKTTIAKLLANKFDISYLDTGATYRALTFKALESKVDLKDEFTLRNLAKSLDLRLEGKAVYLEGEDVSEKIRTPLIDKNISLIVSYPKVREVMVDLQRKIAKGHDYVVEGRDITTVVFPKAEFKFYLDAEAKVRSQRRFNELEAKGIAVDFSEVDDDLNKRDEADKNRKVGALTRASDAIYIDTTKLSIRQVVELIFSHITKENR
ncbi:MAG: (d)CMP kinase [Candidatus Omnitrophota bacterium]|nr:(d)CMP kinase [Candidatus Omnitrophota bacterium]